MKSKLFNLIRMKFHSHFTTIYIFRYIYIKKTNGNHGAKVVTVSSEAKIISFLVFKNQHFVRLQVYFIFF